MLQLSLILISYFEHVKQVYSSISPIVHIVDLGSAATESLANVTVYILCSITP